MLSIFFLRRFFCYLLGVCLFTVSTTSLVMGGDAHVADGAHVVHRPIRPFQKMKNAASASSRAADSRVLLLDFYGDYCGPCRTMDPVIQRLQKQGYNIKKVNTSQQDTLARQFRVTSIPCFVVLADGQEHSRTVGVTPESDLIRMIHAAEKSLPPATVASAVPGRAAEVASRSAWRGLEAPSPVEEIAANRWNPGYNGVLGTAPQTVSDIPASVSPHIASPVMQAPARAAEVAYEHGGTSFPIHPITASAADVRVSEPQSGKPVAEASDVTKNPDPQHLLASTVRVNVYGAGKGSGTIIDCRNGRALILTCGHIFENYRRGDKITVDLFGENRSQNVEANYICHELDRNVNRDLAIISIPVAEPVQVASVAPANFPLRKGMKVVTAGCSNGNLPTTQQAVVTGMNRSMQLPLLYVSVQSISGRSGGGYFSAETGELIAVCIAAIPEENRGLSIPLEVIHDFLSRHSVSQFACNPRNDSLRLVRDQNPRNLMPLTMPEHEPIVQLTSLPRAPESYTPSATTSGSIAAPSGAISPSETAPEFPGHTLTGVAMPAWPPQW